MTVNQPHRDAYLDTLCGMLVVHMILWHIVQHCHMQETLWWQWEGRVLFFFMPWFFFKSGMFFHPMADSREFMRRTARRLLAPFVAWSLIAIPIGLVAVVVSDRAAMWQWYAGPLLKQPLLLGAVGYNGSLWFLTALFLVRLLANYVANFGKNGLATATVLCVVVAVAFQWSPLRWPLLEHTLTGLFFFIAGYALRRLQYRRAVAMTAAVLTALIAVCAFTAVDMNTNRLLLGNHYALYFPFALAAIVTANTLRTTPPPCVYFTHCQWVVASYRAASYRASLYGLLRVSLDCDNARWCCGC